GSSAFLKIVEACIITGDLVLADPRKTGLLVALTRSPTNTCQTSTAAPPGGRAVRLRRRRGGKNPHAESLACLAATVLFQGTRNERVSRRTRFDGRSARACQGILRRPDPARVRELSDLGSKAVGRAGACPGTGQVRLGRRESRPGKT